MTTFRQYDDVAVVEHHDSTRQPREGGKVHAARIVTVGETYTLVKYDDRSLNGDRADQFYSESGWRAWDGQFRWRLVPLCHRCERPVLGEPAADPEDRAGRRFCSEECLTAEAEAYQEQHYRAR